MTELPTQYQQFIHLSRYSRWDYDKKRRETWSETVDSYIHFFREHLQEPHDYDPDGEIEEIREAILKQEIMPSMRCLMPAGPALKKDISLATTAPTSR